MDIEHIRDLVRKGRYSFIEHSDVRKNQRTIFLDDIVVAILGGVVVQEYPNNIPLPRLVIRGIKPGIRPIEVICDLDYETDMVIIVSVERSKSKKSRRIKG